MSQRTHKYEKGYEVVSLTAEGGQYKFYPGEQSSIESLRYDGVEGLDAGGTVKTITPFLPNPVEEEITNLVGTCQTEGGIVFTFDHHSFDGSEWFDVMISFV